MRNHMTLKAIISFLGILAMYFGAWFIYALITHQAFMVLAFRPLILLWIVLAAVLYAMQVYFKEKYRFLNA